MPARPGSTATASRPAARATSLLTAEATPIRCVGAAASTVEVSGATVIDRPRPKMSSAGSRSVANEVFSSMRINIAIPTAATNGPIVIGNRGPRLDAYLPIRDESSSITAVIGSNAEPAASGENPAVRCRTTGSRNNAPDNAAYTTSVARFAPVKFRDLNSDKGTSG